MYIYNVTVKINHFQADKWLRWMRAIHIPTVMATGYFTKNRIFRFIDEGNIEGVTFAIQFTCKNLDYYFAYKTNYAPAMQKQHNQKFEGQFVATRILMEVLDYFYLPAYLFNWRYNSAFNFGTSGVVCMYCIK